MIVIINKYASLTMIVIVNNYASLNMIVIIHSVQNHFIATEL